MEKEAQNEQKRLAALDAAAQAYNALPAQTVTALAALESSNKAPPLSKAKQASSEQAAGV